LAEQRGTLEAVTEALRFIANDDLDYDSWVRIGLAIKGALGDDGWPLFEAWSGRAAKNVPETTVKGLARHEADPHRGGHALQTGAGSGLGACPTLQLNGTLALNGEHPAKAMLQSLGKSMPITASASRNAAQTNPPKAPPMPCRLESGRRRIADMMQLMDEQCQAAAAGARTGSFAGRRRRA
jgi:hypothetical protein